MTHESIPGAGNMHEVNFPDGTNSMLLDADGRSGSEIQQIARYAKDYKSGLCGPALAGETIHIYTPPLTYAKRELERTGVDWATALWTGEAGKQLLEAAQTEATDIESLSASFDTSSYALQEIAARLAGNTDFGDTVPEWEVELLEEQVKTFEGFGALQDLTTYPSDAIFLNHAIQTIKRAAVCLPLIRDPDSIHGLREEVRLALADAWMSVFFNKLPRFYADGRGVLSLDTLSKNWTSGYFKLAKAEPALRTLLNEGHVLDAYGGTGAAANMLVLRGLSKRLTATDLSYVGGRPLSGGHYYQPELNARVIELLYDGLPSWYHPRLAEKTTYIPADSRQLPLGDRSVDHIVADPPYGVECPHGDEELLVASLPEFMRVARAGAALLIPTHWGNHISDAGYEVRQLTDTLGSSVRIPTAFVHVTKLPK